MNDIFESNKSYDAQELFEVSSKLQDVILNQFFIEIRHQLNFNFDRFVKVCTSEQSLCSEFFCKEITRLIMSFHRINNQYKFFSEELESDNSDEQKLCESSLIDCRNKTMSYTINQIIKMIETDLFDFIDNFDQSNKFSKFSKNCLGELVHSLGIAVKHSSKTSASLDDARSLINEE